MFEQFRLILLATSALTFVYGGWLFWSGKGIVEEKRRVAKPRVATLDDLALNPPTKNGEWYRITDGGASVPRGMIQDFGRTADMKNAPFFLYCPVLSNKDAARVETSERLAETRPSVILLLRSQNKKHADTYRAMMRLESSDQRTIDAWLAQNHPQSVIKPPFTGILLRRGTNPSLERRLGPINADFEKYGWILLEGKKPIISDNPQLAIGLALMMGIPTVWLFGLLFAGKLDPPDDEDNLTDRPAKPAMASASSASHGAFVMPSAMPNSDEPQTKTPR